MKYLCLAYGDRQKMEALSAGRLEELSKGCESYDQELRRSGHLVAMGGLDWGATSLRSRGGKVVTTDGPFLETREQVGGFFVIEARDLNEALRIMSTSAPVSPLGEDLGWGLEVRPITELVEA